MRQEWQTHRGHSTWQKSRPGNAGPEMQAPGPATWPQGSEMLPREEPQPLVCGWDLAVPGSWGEAGNLIQALRRAGHW